MKDYKNVNEEIRLKIKTINQTRIVNGALADKLESKLVGDLDYLIYSVIFKYKRFNNYDDLYQEGAIGLLKAIRKFNTDNSFHFCRYSLWWIKARISRSIKKLNLNKNVPYEQKNEAINENDPEKNVIITQDIFGLNYAIEKLPEKHQQIIKMRYGLCSMKEHNLQELSDELNMTREGIRQLEHRILSKLRNNVI